MLQHIDAHDLNLGEVRRRAFRAATQDGLLELVMGAGFGWAALIVALDLILDMPLFFLIGVPASLSLVLMAPLRQHFTHPRIGYVDVVLEEGKRLILGFLIAAVLMGVLALIGTSLAIALQLRFVPIVAVFENLALILGLLFGAAFLFSAVHYGITRFYAFGLLSIVGGLAAQLVNTHWLTPSGDPVARWMLYFAIIAAVLLPVGIVMFARFLIDNPIMDGEAGDGQTEQG